MIIVGSQAILGSIPQGLPKRAIDSFEVDILPFDDPDGSKAERISGAIGEFSQFHETYGYYADGVSLETCVFPSGWEDRLVQVSSEATNGMTGWCVDPHDLCIAKLVACREKDLEYVRAVIKSGHVLPELLIERLGETELSDEKRKYLFALITSTRKSGRNSPMRRAIREFES